MKRVTSGGRNALIQSQVGGRLRRMQETALVAGIGVTEISKTHRYASAVVEQTIATASHMTEAVRSSAELSLHRQAALYHLTQAYIHQIVAVTEDASQEILAVLACLEEYGGD